MGSFESQGGKSNQLSEGRLLILPMNQGFLFYHEKPGPHYLFAESG